VYCSNPRSWLLLALALGCGADATTLLEAEAEVAVEPARTLAWDEFEATVQKLPEGGFMVEGDIWLPTEDQLFAYFEETYLNVGEKSIVDLVSAGVRNVRSPATRIGYCYATTGWGLANTADLNGDGDTTDPQESWTAPTLASVQPTLEAGMDQWERVANVDFVLVTPPPANCTNSIPPITGIDFVVQHYGGTTAIGPLPSNTWANEQLKIPPGGLAGAPNFAAHEVGHSLGFRHEHIHTLSGNTLPTAPAAPGFCFEDKVDGAVQDGDFDVNGAQFEELTAFDTLSTMKYSTCATSQNVSNLPVSALDGVGARALYGAPAMWAPARALLTLL
jgi:hypothetical protein